jgi:hypothetical protein
MANAATALAVDPPCLHEANIVETTKVGIALRDQAQKGAHVRHQISEGAHVRHQIRCAAQEHEGIAS